VQPVSKWDELTMSNILCSLSGSGPKPAVFDGTWLVKYTRELLTTPSMCL